MIFLSIFYLACSDYAIQDVKNPPALIDREPKIEITERDSNDQTINIGCEEDDAFIIKNVGNDDLIINDIELYASVPVDTSTDRLVLIVPITLSPEEEFIIPIFVNPNDFSDDSAILSVSSNDPNKPEAIEEILFRTNSAEVITESFVVETRREVDLLLIVDDSGSMEEEQQRLASNASSIINGLGVYSTDYHIGVITTSSSTLRGEIITNQTINPIDVLATQVVAGIRGSAIERGADMAIEALSIGGSAAPGTPFFRQDSKLVLVWITDEDDHSYRGPRDWANFFLSLKPLQSDVLGWAIIGDPIVGCSSASPGDRESDLAARLGGGWNSICETNWQSNFELLTMVAAANTIFELEKTPIEGTITVYVNGAPSQDWRYEPSLNSVILDGQNRPSAGHSVTIEYVEKPDCSEARP